VLADKTVGGEPVTVTNLHICSIQSRLWPVTELVVEMVQYD
jgi:hypothetical protein